MCELDLQPDDDARPRQVGERADGAAMDPICRVSADRTLHRGCVGAGTNDHAIVGNEERVDVEGRRNEVGGRGDHEDTSAGRAAGRRHCLPVTPVVQPRSP